MLVLSRKVGERINIGNDVVLEVTAINATRVLIGLVAPKKVRILRSELVSKDKNETAVTARRKTN